MFSWLSFTEVVGLYGEEQPRSENQALRHFHSGERDGVICYSPGCFPAAQLLTTLNNLNQLSTTAYLCGRLHSSHRTLRLLLRPEKRSKRVPIPDSSSSNIFTNQAKYKIWKRFYLLKLFLSFFPSLPTNSMYEHSTPTCTSFRKLRPQFH